MNKAPMIAVVAASSLILAGFLVDRKREIDRGELSGTFETQPILVSPRVGGRVVSLSVSEGDYVNAGDVLAVLDSAPDIAQTESLQNQAIQAQLKEKEVFLGQQEDIRKQEAVLADAQAALDRAINGPRKDEISVAKASVREARAQYKEALSGPRPAEIEKARSALDAAIAKANRAHKGPTDNELAKAQADLDSARAQEEVAIREADRKTALADQGAIAGKLAEQARADATSARKKREAAEASLRNLQTRPEDIRAADAEVRQSREALRLLTEGTRNEEKDAAKARLDQIEANLSLLESGTRPEDIASARAKVQQAKITLNALMEGSRNLQTKQSTAATRAAQDQAKASRIKSSEQVVRAVRSGYIERRLVACGDLITAGQTVFRMSDPIDLHLRVYLPESALALVQLNDVAEVKCDGLDHIVACRVESIATQGEFTPANLQTPEERGKQVFAVRLKLDDKTTKVKPGMAASVLSIGQWKQSR